jgi:predicted transposase YbfD/YdcC
MRALTNWPARCLPVWINVLSRSRSSSLSVTTYLFTAICFAVTILFRRSRGHRFREPSQNQRRGALVCTDIAWLQEQHAWPSLGAIGKVVRRREVGTETSSETAYYLLSNALSAERFGEVARAHWGVENGLHWVLDVTMNEDQARNHKDHGPQNIALLRRLALNLAKLEGSKGSMKGKFKRAGWDDAFLASLLAQFGRSHMR